MGFDIWVDADSVPKNLRQIILRACARLGCACFFVADRELPDVKQFIADDTFRLRQKAREEGLSDEKDVKAVRSRVCMVVVQSGADSADDRIAEQAHSPALCITHDIPLASRLLEKGCTVIDDRGTEYSASNIRALLGDREVNRELRSWGVFAQKQSRMDGRNTKAFADCLDRTIARMGGNDGQTA